VHGCSNTLGCCVQAFKYNTLETLYLVTAMFILLAGTWLHSCGFFWHRPSPSIRSAAPFSRASRVAPAAPCPSRTSMTRPHVYTHWRLFPPHPLHASCCAPPPHTHLATPAHARHLALPVGMAFQSGVAAVNSTPHLALTWAVAVVLVGCVALFLGMLGVEVWRSVHFARRVHSVRKASIKASPVGRAAQASRQWTNTSLQWTDNPLFPSGAGVVLTGVGLPAPLKPDQAGGGAGGPALSVARPLFPPPLPPPPPPLHSERLQRQGQSTPPQNIVPALHSTLTSMDHLRAHRASRVSSARSSAASSGSYFSDSLPSHAHDW
jgi:hypothetical protein